MPLEIVRNDTRRVQYLCGTTSSTEYNYIQAVCVLNQYVTIIPYTIEV